MKIGITASNLTNFWSNGHTFNVLLWYSLLEKIGYDCTFLAKIVPKDKKDKYNFLDLAKINSDTTIEDLPEFFDFDVIFILGFYFGKYMQLVEKTKIKVIKVDLGSTYHNDVRDVIYKDSKKNFFYRCKADEIWISPHFKYSQKYIKAREKTNVFTCPYFWREDLFKDYKEKVAPMRSKLKVAIVEPNLEQAKNALPAILICEKAEQNIEKVYVCNTAKFSSNIFFTGYIKSLDLFKKNKLFIERRFRLSSILTVCNCVVSFVDDCDLNYVYLECFYLGVPLVHNSPMLKDYGYYYPKLDIEKGAEQIKNIIKNHNREKYIEKHKKILHTFSIENPINQKWVKQKLEGKRNHNFNLRF